jgi:hypothetical protein
MKSRKVKGDHVTFNTLVNGCVYGRQLESAYQICLDSFALKVKLAGDVYNNLLQNLVNSRDSVKLEWAAKVCHNMKSIGVEPEYNVYSKVVKQLYGENVNPAQQG